MNRWLQLAWRNIWRNKRRTLISAASVAFAVMFAISMNSLQKGGWDRMLDNVIRFYFGYAQVHGAGYWEEQTIDRSLALDTGQIARWQSLAGGYELVPRLESFALASTGPATMGVLVSGVDPEAEQRLTGLKDRLVRGRYLDAAGHGALLAEGLAAELGLDLGDTLVLLSQGYQGVSAADKFPVTGIVSFGSPDLNKLFVFLALPVAQNFFGAEDRATSLVVAIDHNKAVPGVLQRLRSDIQADEHEVLGWEEMIPDLVQARALDDAGSVIVLLILYIIIAFGLFGTVLMMTKEREYEFGVLVAIGMRRGRLIQIVWAEIVFISAVGALIGMALALPVVTWFHYHPLVFTGQMAEAYEKFGVEPIIPTAISGRIFLNQALIVFVLASLMVVYPLQKIRFLSPVQSMRH